MIPYFRYKLPVFLSCLLQKAAMPPPTAAGDIYRDPVTEYGPALQAVAGAATPAVYRTYGQTSRGLWSVE